MQQYKFHDELLWRSMPEGADIRISGTAAAGNRRAETKPARKQRIKDSF